MCNHADREAAMVVVARDSSGEPSVWCDPCIKSLVEALQGVGTVASCCGHGERFGNIALADGRELLIAPNYEAARRAERSVIQQPACVFEEALELCVAALEELDVYQELTTDQLAAMCHGRAALGTPAAGGGE